jgi:hypothetical protein
MPVRKARPTRRLDRRLAASICSFLLGAGLLAQQPGLSSHDRDLVLTVADVRMSDGGSLEKAGLEPDEAGELFK